jgi:hypothetical protein
MARFSHIMAQRCSSRWLRLARGDKRSALPYVLMFRRRQTYRLAARGILESRRLCPALAKLRMVAHQVTISLDLLLLVVQKP